MAAIDLAIADLQAEIDALKPGTSDAPKEGSKDWYRLRALAAGTSLLKGMRNAACDNSGAEEQFFRKSTRDLKLNGTLDASA